MMKEISREERKLSIGVIHNLESTITQYFILTICTFASPKGIIHVKDCLHD